MIGLWWVVLSWDLSHGWVRCCLQPSQGSPGLDIEDDQLIWLTVVWEPCWGCQTECLHMASTCVMDFQQHSGWVTKGNILRASMPRDKKEKLQVSRSVPRNRYSVSSAVLCWSEQSQNLSGFNKTQISPFDGGSGRVFVANFNPVSIPVSGVAPMYCSGHYT